MARVTQCRSCNSSHLSLVLDLGRQPIANALRESADIGTAEETFPLEIAFCHECTLLQVLETIPADTLFKRDYPYYSSYSADLLKHSRAHALALVEERALGPDHFVIEVAGNDGYLLKNFVELGIPVLNIDPALGQATVANAQGIPTINDFFGAELAASLAAQGKKADVILANNVAAHVDGINDFFAGFPLVLADDGIIEIEVAYVFDMVTSNEFDTIYHEHLFYYSITAFEALVERHGLHLNDVQRLDIHGGSIRARISKHPGSTERLRRLKSQETVLGVNSINFYADFASRANHVREKLHALVTDLKSKGTRIAAYGAAAKGATLLNYVGLDHKMIDYVVDLNTNKAGKFMPGDCIPIKGADELVKDQPDYVLLLAWNFCSEIVKQQSKYLRAGGAFIIPVPDPHVIDIATKILG